MNSYVENALISLRKSTIMPESISQLTAIWNRSLKRIKDKLGDDHIYDTFFGGSYIDSVQGDTLLIAVTLRERGKEADVFRRSQA